MYYYFDEFAGGVTAGGYAPYYAGSGTGTIQLHFPYNATVRQAFLFAGDHHCTTPLTLTLNGKEFTFNDSNIVTPGFYSFYAPPGEPAYIHAVDVRSAIDPAQPAQTLSVPDQTATGQRFTDYYLLVTYNVPGHTISRVSMFLDTTGFDTVMNYTLPVINHSGSTTNLSLGLYTGYICASDDAEDIFCNGTKLGNIYGPEKNSGGCAGPYANFYYDNGILHGLGDDNADLQMTHADALSNIRTLVNPNDSFLTLQFVHTGTRNKDNSIWGVVLVDGDTGCSEVSAVSADPPQINFNPRTICAGADSITELLTNTGCDPLVISAASLTGDPDYSAPGLQSMIIRPHDSMRVTVYLTPHTKGPKQGSLWLTSYSINDPADSIKNVIKLNGTIGDGPGVLNCFPAMMSFQKINLCSSGDSVPGFIVNTGCDTAYIDGTSLTASEYTSSILQPGGVAPQDTMKFTIYLTPQSIGIKQGRFILNWHSIGSPPLPVSDTVSIDAEVEDEWHNYSFFFDPPKQKGSADETVRFILRTDADMAGVRTIDFDLLRQTEMLSFVSGGLSNRVTCSGNHIHIEGSPFIAVKDSVIDTLLFSVNLTKDSIDLLGLLHIQINGNDSTLTPCSAITSVSGSTFSYEYLCGDRSIQNAMKGIMPLGITGLHPNPASGEVNLDIESTGAGEISVAIMNSFGLKCCERQYRIKTGRQTLAIDTGELPSGAYLLELSGIAGKRIAHFIKIQ